MKKDIICIEKEDLENSLETIPSFMNEIIKVLNKAYDAVDGDKLKEDILFSKLNIENNKDLFIFLINLNKKYLEIVPELKSKVNELVGKRVCSNTSDINLLLLAHVVSLGALIAYGSLATAIYAISKIDEKLSSILDKYSYIEGEYFRLSGDIVNFLLNSENVDIKKIVDVIGTIPYIEEEELRNLIITKKLSRMSIDNGIISYIKSLATAASRIFRPNKINRPYIKEFINNPIYHLRLYLTDLEIARLEKLKDEKRLLELYILELKEKGDTKGIEFYQKKLDDINRKINAYLRY